MPDCETGNGAVAPARNPSDARVKPKPSMPTLRSALVSAIILAHRC